MCDYDMPSAIVESVRKARKDHKCCECLMPIHKGSKYQHISGIWDNYPRSYKTCVSCATVRNLETEKDSDRCGPYFGGLREHLEEKYFDFTYKTRMTNFHFPTPGDQTHDIP